MMWRAKGDLADIKYYFKLGSRMANQEAHPGEDVRPAGLNALLVLRDERGSAVGAPTRAESATLRRDAKPRLL